MPAISENGSDSVVVPCMCRLVLVVEIVVCRLIKNRIPYECLGEWKRFERAALFRALVIINLCAFVHSFSERLIALNSVV